MTPCELAPLVVDELDWWVETHTLVAYRVPDAAVDDTVRRLASACVTAPATMNHVVEGLVLHDLPGPLDMLARRLAALLP